MPATQAMAVSFISGSSPPPLEANTAGWMERHSRAERKTSGTSRKATTPTTAQIMRLRWGGRSRPRSTR